MPFNNGMVKQAAVHLCRGPCNEKEWTTDTHNSMDLKGIMLGGEEKQNKKKPVSKDYILYDSICTTFFKWQNYEMEHNSGFHALGMGRAG